MAVGMDIAMVGGGVSSDFWWGCLGTLADRLMPGGNALAVVKRQLSGELFAGVVRCKREQQVKSERGSHPDCSDGRGRLTD